MTHPAVLDKTTALGLRKGDELHENGCTISYGATGKARPLVITTVWRVNGRARTWKRQPDRFEIPLKHGLYNHSYLTQDNAHHFHLPSVCAVTLEAEQWWEKKYAEEKTDG